jgi:hypothetical protein
MRKSVTAERTDLSPVEAWSQRVKRVGGFIQLAFAAFWLVRGVFNLHGQVRGPLAIAFCLVALVVVVYGIFATAGTGPRLTSPEAKRIERSVTIATVIELIAAFVLPVIVVAAGRSDWVLPSIAITIGPLLLWLDRLVPIPRYRAVGWLLTIGPVVLVATMSGASLAATTGIAAGFLLLATAGAGFHDLARLRPPRLPAPAKLNPHTA